MGFPYTQSEVYVDSVLYLLCFCVCLFIGALWSPAGKGMTSWLSFVMSKCEVVTFPLVSWVRCGAWLYRFLIFALSLTFKVGFYSYEYGLPRIPYPVLFSQNKLFGCA